MNILVMGMNYAPEETAIGPLTTQLSEYMVQQGHRVTVATAFPHYPDWKVSEYYKGKVWMQESANGVRIYRSWVYVPGKQNPLQRIAYDSSFSVSAFVSSLMVRGIDVIVCISPPLQLGLTAWLVSELKRVPFLFQIQDIIPDTAVALGMLRNEKVIHLASRLEKFVYDKASAIGVISHGFAENLYTKGVSKSKVHYLPNWIDLDFVKPTDRDNVFRQQNGLFESDFLVMYAGNIGNKQGLETLLDAASILRKDRNIVFFIVGEGARKTALLEKAGKMNLSNLHFLEFQPSELLPQMFSAADILVLTQQASVTDICMPSKLLYNMASATPIVAVVNARSEAAKAIRESNGGLIVEPENPEGLAKAILRLYTSSELKKQLGSNGRTFVSEHFEKYKVLRKFENLLYSMANTK